jgi:hypothetical protein
MTKKKNPARITATAIASIVIMGMPADRAVTDVLEVDVLAEETATEEVPEAIVDVALDVVEELEEEDV